MAREEYWSVEKGIVKPTPLPGIDHGKDKVKTKTKTKNKK